MNFLKSVMILSTGFFIILYAGVPLRLRGSLKDKTGLPISGLTDYKWSQVIKPGNGRFQEKCEEGNWPMAILPIIAFENKLWMTGHKKSWSSGDGIKWSVHTKTDWGERYGMSYAFFKNKLWMLAGMITWDDFRNDVWVSEDGTNWKQVLTKASWQPRRGQNLLAFKNKLWLYGGELSSGKHNQTPYEFLNDTWSSTDGISWMRESATVPWPPNNTGQILMFHDKLWMINSTDKKIWNTSDGKKWNLVTDKLPWQERQGNGVLVFDDLLWIFGGIERNDSWFSADGIQWQQLNEHAPWSPRSAQYSVAFNNKLWIFSGKTGREDSWSGDVWMLEKTTSTENVLAIK